MRTTKDITEQIIKSLQKDQYQDLSDVGNLIGAVLGLSVPRRGSDDGNDLEGFNFGLAHGFDLTEKPKPQCGSIILKGSSSFCPECGSSRIRRFLIFGRLKCINPNCKTNQEEKNENC